MKTATKKPAAKSPNLKSPMSNLPSSSSPNLKSPISNPPSPKARRLEEIAESKKGLFAIDPTLLSIEPGFNKRENFGDLRQLAEDIAANGLDQPLKIRKLEGTETIYIVSGHRRHRAITEILIPEKRWHGTVDCYSEPKHTCKIDRLVSQISGNTGLPFTLLEKAAVYQEILATDSTLKPADIARRFGESKQAVSDALRLINAACPELAKAVRDGELAASTAIAIIKQATDPEDQALLLSKARLAALSSAREHIMPKDIPHSGAGILPAAPSEIVDSGSEIEDAKEPSQSPLHPQSPIPNIQSSFQLYLIDGTPEDPIATDSPFYHETDRLVLENPPEKLGGMLHLLCAATPFGVAYGFRVDDHEHLPDVSHLESLDASPEAGFKHALQAAIRRGLIPESSDWLQDLLYDALCRYYPEQGNPEEPKHLVFVATPEPQTPTGSANPGFQQTLAASTGGGGNGGGGSSTYLDPQTFKCLEKIEKVLEDLSAKGQGIQDRVTTADIVCGILRNERPSSDLKNYLTGK